jgi:hypothetical protein
VRLRTSKRVIPKSRKLTATPLSNTKRGRSLPASSSNPGNVAKYRLHSRPATSIPLSSANWGSPPPFPARFTLSLL